MKFKIDNLQYCNWSRKIFEINREADLDAVHVTIVYHEDFDELLIEIQKWEKLFKDNSDLIFLGRSYKDIEKANKENKTAIFFGFQNCSPIEDDINLTLLPYADIKNIISTSPKNWDLVSFALTNQKCYKENKLFLSIKEFNCYSTQGYLINRKGMKKFINNVVNGNKIILKYNF